jgi:hypothetical protein
MASVEDTRTFLITLEIAPASAVAHNPSLWWAALPDAPSQCP